MTFPKKLEASHTVYRSIILLVSYCLFFFKLTACKQRKTEIIYFVSIVFDWTVCTAGVVNFNKFKFVEQNKTYSETTCSISADITLEVSQHFVSAFSNSVPCRLSYKLTQLLLSTQKNANTVRSS